MAAVKRYPVELKQRAVVMVRDLERELGPGNGALARVARQLGVHPEALRYWVRRDEKVSARRVGVFLVRKRSESPRVSRRLHFLRGWSDVTSVEELSG